MDEAAGGAAGDGWGAWHSSCLCATRVITEARVRMLTRSNTCGFYQTRSFTLTLSSPWMTSGSRRGRRKQAILACGFLHRLANLCGWLEV